MLENHGDSPHTAVSLSYGASNTGYYYSLKYYNKACFTYTATSTKTSYNFSSCVTNYTQSVESFMVFAYMLPKATELTVKRTQIIQFGKHVCYMM